MARYSLMKSIGIETGNTGPVFTWHCIANIAVLYTIS